MQERHIKITRTARYCELGVAGNEVRRVWFVLHGYGYLAAHFAKNFESMASSENLIVAPEGLSRFYLQGFSGRVGASWMTSEARLLEIADYVDFLDGVHEDVVQRVDRDKVETTLLGFSQGAATASRWLCFGKAQIDNLIVWAGLIPQELSQPDNLERFQSVDLTLVYGTQDELATADRIAQQAAFLRKHKIACRLISFEGGHTLTSDVLQKVVGTVT